MMTLNQTDCHFHTLPLELVHNIFRFVPDLKTHLRYARSCRKARYEISDVMAVKPQLLSSYFRMLFKKEAATHIIGFFDRLAINQTKRAVVLPLSSEFPGLPDVLRGVGAIFPGVTLRFMGLMPSKELLSCCPAIQGLDFGHVRQKTDTRTLEELFAQCLTLRELHAPPGQESFESLTLPSGLELLDLRFTKVSDIALRSILTKCSSLQELDVRSCMELRQFETLPFNSLKKLIACDCNIGDAGFHHILTSCRALEHLDISSCSNISEQALVHGPYPASLKTLTLRGCKVTSGTREAIYSQVPGLSIIE